MNTSKHSRKWPAIIGIIFVILLLALSIFFYHNFFRQSNAQLIETVPSNTAFILQINNNDEFIKSSKHSLPALNELLTTDGLLGIEFVIDKFSTVNNIIISGHQNNDKKALLVSAKVSEADFKKLLEILRIDNRNFLPFDNAKIYSYGTHYKKYHFTFQSNVFSISEDVELLKKSIVQHKHPRNLLSNKEFANLCKLLEKNDKQNWLIIHHPVYFENYKQLLTEKIQPLCTELATFSNWSAFQIRFYDKEISMSGYIPDNADFFRKFKGQQPVANIQESIIPFNSDFYAAMKFSDPARFVDNFNTPEGAVDISGFSKINPLESYYFTLKHDSTYLRYLAVKIDTTKSIQDLFQPDSITPSPSIYQQYKIYPSAVKDFNNVLSSLHQKASVRYFVEYDGFYIYSDTTTSLHYYLKNVTQNSFKNQMLYRFSKANLPSENNYEFCFIVPDRDKLPPYLSSEAIESPIGNSIQVFSFSFSAPKNGFVPTNVYIKLQ